MKKYKFRAANKIFQILQPLICAANNFAIVVILSEICLALLGKLGLAAFLTQNVVMDYIVKVILIIAAAYAFLHLVMPKGCYLYDDKVVISRYTITVLNWKNRISFPYYMIKNAYVRYDNIFLTKYHLFELVPYCDYQYNVVIELRDGKKYIFSVSDAESCCLDIMNNVEKYIK